MAQSLYKYVNQSVNDTLKNHVHLYIYIIKINIYTHTHTHTRACTHT